MLKDLDQHEWFVETKAVVAKHMGLIKSFVIVTDNVNLFKNYQDEGYD